MEEVEQKDEDMSVDQIKPSDESKEQLESEDEKLKTADVPDAQVEKNDSQDSDKTEEADDNKDINSVDKPAPEADEKPTDDGEKKDEKSEKEVDEDDKDEEEEVEEVVVLEDIEDDGEDPSEVEVEKFNQPSEHGVLNDLSELKMRRKVLIHPLKITDLSHPVLLEAIGKSSEFRTCFAQSVTDNRPVWAGSAEINFRSSFVASESLQTLKTVREDITVRCLEAGESTKNSINMVVGVTESQDANKKLISNILIVKAVAEEATIDILRGVFTTASDIVIPQNQKSGKRMAYAVYDGEEVLDEAIKTFADKQPEIEGKPLRVYKYQPSAEMPTGMLKMKRRYRILLQMDKLKKAMKDKKANHTKNVKNMMSSTIQHCNTLIEKDDTVRKEIGFAVYSLAELRRYKRIREAVKEDTIWLPGKKMHGPDRRGFLDDEDEEDKHRRYSRLFQSEKSDSGIPSLMSVAVDLKFTPPISSRPHASPARMGPAGPPMGPPGPGMPPLLPMRGAPGGSGPRGMARGGPRGMIRGGPGGFRGGRGGFHDGPPPPTDNFDFESSGSFRGRRGGFDHGFSGGDRGFGRGGYGRGGEGGGYGRGGREGGSYGRGGNEDGYNRGEGAGYGRGGESGYGRGSFNKRPRSPPGGGTGGSGSRGYRGSSQDSQDSSQHASKMPRKDSDDGRQSRWSSGREDSRGGSARGGGRGGYRQGQDNNSWNRPSGGSRSDNTNSGYGKGGYSGNSGNVYGQTPSGGAANNYNQTPAPPAQNNYNAASSQTGAVNTNMAGYGQPPVAQSSGNMSGYGQAGNVTGYGQQGTGMAGYDQNSANANTYNQTAASTGYGQAAYGQAGYGQTGVAGYGQTQDQTAAAYGYTQPTSTDYYQTAAASGYQSGMVTYPPANQTYQSGATTTPQQPAATGTTATGWGMQQQQQPAQQQYWTGDQSQQQQPAASWPTGAEGTASATVDPNAAYGYNWAAAAGWKQ